MAHGLDMVFAEIAELEPLCKFSDCTHSHEPNCAVLRAVSDGRINPERFSRWRKLQDENTALGLISIGLMRIIVTLGPMLTPKKRWLCPLRSWPFMVCWLSAALRSQLPNLLDQRSDPDVPGRFSGRR